MKGVILTIGLALLLFSNSDVKSCSYIPGDANGDTHFTGLDAVYSVRYFKGGPLPPFSCECTPGHTWYIAGDVNGSCSFSGLDVTYMVRYFKGGAAPIPCPDCPPQPVQVPLLTTAAVSAVTQTTAECGGTITSEGEAPVTDRGVCWSTDSTPSIDDSKTTDGSGPGSFTSSIAGLTLGTLYYLRAYATNSAGTGYGSIISFTTTDSMGTVTDIDGNTYVTVKICNQWWMAENLKVTHYRNGNPVPYVADNTSWSNLTTGAYCNYNNDSSHVVTYGRLYNWYAAADSNNIAPAGWHVPCNAEWQTLIDCLNPNAGGKMKEAGTALWLSPNTGAINSSGFTAFPGGYRYGIIGDYSSMGAYDFIWSSTEYSSIYAWCLYLSCNNAEAYLNFNFDGGPQNGYSIRCIKDSATLPVVTTAAVSEVTDTMAQCGGNITSDGGALVTARGVCWSTDSIPTIADSKTTDGSGSGSFTSSITELNGVTQYYIRAYATNIAGTGYGDILSFTTTDSMGTVTDIDGNTYITVKICNHWWMAENLKVTHYRNGGAITYVADSATWSGLTSEAYCNYGDDSTNVAIYGRLYNWYAVNDSRNIAPAGWHVPTDAEWQTLVDCLGGDAVAGGNMKESGTVHWLSPNTGATNESGFSALPGGFHNGAGNYNYMSYHAYFWSSTDHFGVNAWYRQLVFNYSDVRRLNNELRNGFSIRCVKDSTTVPVVTTAAVSGVTQTTAGCGGTITSDGGASVIARGVCWSTNPTPTVDDSKTTDGAGMGSFSSSITGLTANTAYYVRAYATNSVGTGYGDIDSFNTAEESTTGTVTDIDGNVYQTIKIGNQWWMAENLKVTHYQNGDGIPNVMDLPIWSVLSKGAYCNYNNDTNNVATYGRLYNWFALTNSRNIAPAGWHVPNDAEWDTLIYYLGGYAVAGGKMKEAGFAHWRGPNTGATNECGFTALPGGGRSPLADNYDGMETDAYFWSSTDIYGIYAWRRVLGYNGSDVARDYLYKQYGYSVRCVKD
jgi:uncharacterized protein (TIGR02145 family)